MLTSNPTYGQGGFLLTGKEQWVDLWYSGEKNLCCHRDLETTDDCSIIYSTLAASPEFEYVAIEMANKGENSENIYEEQ